MWLSFERHRGTGKIVLRHRIIKGTELGRDQDLLVMVKGKNGFLEAWDALLTSDMSALNHQRQGFLIWGRT